MAPDVRIELIRRPERASMTEAGAYSPDELAEMLTGLNSEDYRDHDKWVGVMMACHDATAGDGREEFIAWSTSDPQYAADAWIIGRRWDSLHAGTVGQRVTVKTLYKHLHAAGRGGLIPRVSPEEEFAEGLGDKHRERVTTQEPDRCVPEAGGGNRR